MSGPVARRGDVWFTDVPGDKRRPVLVLSRDPMARLLHSVICAPITSRIRGLSTEVSLGEGSGLVQASVANIDSVFLLSRSRLVRCIGRLTSEAMTEACNALGAATGC